MLYSAIILWNILTFFLYGWDKLCAKQHWRRIPENVLIGCSFVMGASGALFGMVIWNHKTSKMKFRLLIPFSVVLNVALLWMIQFV